MVWDRWWILKDPPSISQAETNDQRSLNTVHHLNHPPISPSPHPHPPTNCQRSFIDPQRFVDVLNRSLDILQVNSISARGESSQCHFLHLKHSAMFLFAFLLLLLPLLLLLLLLLFRFDSVFWWMIFPLLIYSAVFHPPSSSCRGFSRFLQARRVGGGRGEGGSGRKTSLPCPLPVSLPPSPLPLSRCGHFADRRASFNLLGRSSADWVRIECGWGVKTWRKSNERLVNQWNDGVCSQLTDALINCWRNESCCVIVC